MAKGGKREGSGRPKGAHNKKTQEQVEAIEESGLTPLEYLLEVMRSPLPVELNDAIEAGSVDAKIIASLISWHARRMEAAKTAAPFVHPRLAATEISGPDGGEIPVRFIVKEIDAKN